MTARLWVLCAGRFLPLGRFLVLTFVRGWVDPRAIVRLEGLGKLKKSTSSGTRIGDLPACSIVPQPTTLPRAPIYLSTSSKWLFQYQYMYRGLLQGHEYGLGSRINKFSHYLFYSFSQLSVGQWWSDFKHQKWFEFCGTASTYPHLTPRIINAEDAAFSRTSGFAT
jgi:hypothetical protein